MKKLIVKSLVDLAEAVHIDASLDKNVCVVLFFDEAKELLRYLLDIDGNKVGCIDIGDPAFDDYEGEYIISIFSDSYIFVEKAKDMKDGKYLGYEADEVFVDGRANYGVVKANMNDECEYFELQFDEEPEKVQDSKSADKKDAFLSLIDKMLELLEEL